MSLNYFLASIVILGGIVAYDKKDEILNFIKGHAIYNTSESEQGIEMKEIRSNDPAIM